MIRICAGCLKKQQRIDELEEEVVRLKANLRYQQRQTTEGVFGSSTPSSKRPVKANTLAERQTRRGGARPGHVGHGRSAASETSADRIETLRVPTTHCPTCQGLLTTRGFCRRTVIEIPSIRPQTILYRLEIKRCSRCRRTVRAHAPAVLPKALYGNELLTHVATQHYVHGVPLGRLEDHLDLGIGSVIDALHRLAQLVRPVAARLVQEYRHAPVKHADETGWRTDGQNGYVWLFATPQLSVFRFRKTRSAVVPKEVFGTKRLPGVLVVDRYNAYNRVPCAIQYCYAHLLRDVTDLAQEFPQSGEVHAFSQALAPLLSEAMGLRSASITQAAFHQQARRIKQRILQVVQHPAQHPGVQQIQDIFRTHAARLYHWAAHRQVPADNNLAERDLRPSVIARKVSFGSQSEAGAWTRETLMTVLCTLRKRSPQDVARRFRHALDTLATHPTRDPYRLLFHDRPPP